MTISQRIFELLEQKGKKQKDLAAAVGISTSAISDWKKKNTNPSAENLSAIADFLEVSLEYLVTGVSLPTSSLSSDEQQMLSIYQKLSAINKARVQERALTLAEQENDNKDYSVSKCTSLSEYETVRDFIELPLYDIPVSAGTGSFLDEAEAELIKIPKTNSADNADYMVRVSGNSMEPRFADGDVVLVEKTEQIQVGDIGIFVVNSEAFIKQYDRGRLISLNPRYKPIVINENDTANCIGKVIAVLEVSKRV